MSRTSTRVYLSVSVVVATLLCFAALGGTAFAAPGDSIGNATSLDPYFGSSLTTNLAVAPMGLGGGYYFRVGLSPGDTLRADFTSSPDVINLKALVLPITSGYPIVESVVESANVQRLVFTAPVTGMYNVYVGTSTLGTFTVEPAMAAVSIAGGTRYETAVEISKKAFSTAETVLVANGKNWPDALGGAALTKATAGPILLTDPNALPSSVSGEIDRLGATKAIILGGSGSVSTNVENTLKGKLGPTNVTRIGGGTRYETASLIANETVARLGASYDGWAFVSTGGSFPDALAASPLAAAKGWPIFLVPPTGPDQDTIDAMDAAGVTDVVILGGTGAVSSAVQGDLEAKFGAGHVLRKQGGTRYATAIAVATFGVEQCGLTWNKLALATGTNFPDALAGGVLQGRDGSVMLLTPSTALDSGVAALLGAKKATIDEIRYLGGTGSVSQAVRKVVAGILW